MKQNGTSIDGLDIYRAKIRKWRQKLILTRIVVFLSIAVTIPYFYWRATETKNPVAMWFFYLFLAAEMLNFFESLLLYVTTWKPTWHPAPPPPPKNCTVDVLIPSLDEPVHLRRETLICSLGILYPHRTWLLDDGNRPEARDLAPQTFPGFATQWQRWGHGAMQVLRRENPLFGRGLKLGQRLCYFASFYFYWMSYQKMSYVLTPIFCLLSGIFPLVADPAKYLLFFTPYLLLNVAASSMLTGGLRGFLMSEEFNMMKMPVLMKTILGLSRSEGKFRVTPKSQSSAARLKEVWPLVAIELALAAAIVVGIWRLWRATSSYTFWALVVNLAWASFYLLLLGPLVSKALKRQEQRCAYRFPGSLEVPMRFEYRTPKGAPVRDRAYVRNLNRTGLSVTLASPLPMDTRLELELSLASQPIRAVGRVMRHMEIRTNGHVRYANGVRFDEISATDADTISKYLFWYVAPRHGDLLRLTRVTQGEERPRWTT